MSYIKIAEGFKNFCNLIKQKNVVNNYKVSMSF